MTTSKHAFAHLHVHTEYSILDGISPIPQLVTRARDLGMDALAITDHGVMHGAIDFYSECRQQDIRPIIGCEVYVAPQSRHLKDQSNRSAQHLTLLAKDNAGYQNLIQMVSKSHLEGFYYKPRVDRELLELHSNGLYCLSGCMSGELASLIAKPDSDMQPALDAANWYSATFPDRYFLEIQRHHNVPNLESYNHNLLRLAKETGLPLVATNDSHYTTAEQSQHQDTYVAIQTTSQTDDQERLHMSEGSYYLKSPTEMARLFEDIPETITNTLSIARDCNVEFDFTKRMPAFPTPEGLTSDQYLRQLCEEGFRKLCPPHDPRYRQRLDYELDVIRQMDFADYFLIVWDIIRFTRERGIQYGVRGSAAASLALHCLSITVADPIQYGLVFERFLNLERKEMPDIDIDFQDDRREEPLNYVVNRYGKEQVAQIITFGKYRPKSAVKAAGKALGVPYKTCDDLAKLIPAKADSVRKAVEASNLIQRMIQADPQIEKLVDNADGITDIVHQQSTHAAGVVIAAEPITNIAPVQRSIDEDSDLILTQYSMEPIAKLGLVKMDFLSLTSLTILDQVLASIPDAPASLADIPLDDPATYKLLATGNTTNVFQLESTGMQRHIADLKPSNLGDISAMIALYRPGPMEEIDRFIRSKHGQERITYPHPSMKQLLDETYGVIVYQDQVLQIMRDFAGYSLGQADIVRKAMGKKIPELMRQERAAFLEGAAEQGYDHDTATSIFDLIEPFAGYAFNKAHSISYALVAYWTAYFKANHPVPYMTAVINCRRGQNKQLYQSAGAECERLNIRLLTPCVNASEQQARPEGPHAIRLGLDAVRGIPEATVHAIVHNRNQGPYLGLADFCKRSPRLPARVLETLVKSGALDQLAPRSHCLQYVDEIAAAIDQEATNRESGQTNLFDLGSDHQLDQHFLMPPQDAEPTDPSVLARMETEALGIPISHRLSEFLARTAGPDAVTAAEQLAHIPDGSQITVAGIVQAVSKRNTRDGKPFQQVELQMADGSIEIMVWNETLSVTQGLWELHTPLSVTGQLSHRDQGPSLAATAATLLEATAEPPHIPLHLNLIETEDEAADQALLQSAIMTSLRYPGDDPVYLNLHLLQGRQVTMLLPTVTAAAHHPELRCELEAMGVVAPAGDAESLQDMEDAARLATADPAAVATEDPT